MLHAARRALVGAIVVVVAAAAAAATPVAHAATGWAIEGDLDGVSGFGAAVALGDVDGDGFDDLLVGAPLHANGAGHARLYRGGPGGVDQAALWKQTGQEPGGHFGEVVAALGDVNGDGRVDFAIGEPWAGPSEVGSERGRVWLLAGAGEQGLVELARWDGAADQQRFGAVLLGPGDVNGDGLADLLVGSPDDAGGAGRVALYLGDTQSFGAAPSWELHGAPGERLGATLAKTWDVDGDQRADFLVGGAGGVALFLGEADGSARFERLVAPDEGGLGDLDGDGLADLTAGAALGLDLDGPAALVQRPAPAGDVDGDGIPDAWVLTGDPEVPVRLVAGRDGTPLMSPACSGCAADAVSAGSVALGDVDGDGYADLAMGVRDRLVGELALGTVFVLRGGPQVAPVPWARWPSGRGAFGAAGDLEGDGFADVVTTAPTGELVARHGGPGGLAAVEPLGPVAWTHAAADLDGDGDGELVLAGDDAVQILGLRANPGWRFALEPGAQPGRWLALGDFDGDGDGDLVIGTAAHLGRPSAEGFWGALGGVPDVASWTGFGPPFAPGAPTLVAVGHVTGARRSDLAARDANGRFALLGDDEVSVALSRTLEGPGGALSVAPAGDVDGDGYDDLIVVRADGSELWWGAASGLVSAPLHLEGGVASGAGDLDRDGRDDLVMRIGDVARVVWGPCTAKRADLLPVSAVAVAAAGDLDGDGAGELLADDGVETHLFSFLPRGRLALAPRARERDGSRTLASEVATRARGALAIDARAVSPSGGDAVALEVQLARLGTPLAQGAIVTSPFEDRAPGERLTLALADLGDGVAYRYRARLRFPRASAPVHVTTPWVYGGVGPRRGVVVTRPLVPPVAYPDSYAGWQTLGVAEQAPGVLINDVAPDGERLTATVVASPRHGDLIFNPDGAFMYSPRNAFWGRDAFSYRAKGDGGSAVAQVDLVIKPEGACFGRTEAPCRQGRFGATLRRADGTLVGVRCRREAGRLACDLDADGALALTAPTCAAEHR